MPAYLLLLVAVLSRLLPHAGWMNFTAVGGALLYFGARRSWREMLAPLAAADGHRLLPHRLRLPLRLSLAGYLPTWAWYVMAMALGQILLHSRTTFVRVGAAALLGPTSFFLVSNYAVWAGGGMYPRTLGGLGACYVAGLPFYRNDLISTAIVVAGWLWGSGAGAAVRSGAGTGSVGGEVDSFRCQQVRQVDPAARDSESAS